MIDKLDNPKTEKYLECKKFVLGTNFPWFYNGEFVHNDSPSSRKLKNLSEYNNISFLSHDFLTRPLPGRKYSVVNSNHTLMVYQVMEEILEYNKIEFECVFRINANMVYPASGIQETIPHRDHTFPHKNLLIYLTESGGETICENETFIPHEDDVITFDGLHNFVLPKENPRIVLVATYI